MAFEAIFRHEGDFVDYTPGAAVSAGEVVVQGTMVGVATKDIAASTRGALRVGGVFDFAKGSGAITAGALVYWNDTANQATTTASGNKLIGPAVEAAADGDSTVRALLAQRALT